MHFSRNPPGPNTSRIEGFSGPFAGPSVAPSGAIPLAPASSSTGTYSRLSVVAEFLFLFSIESVAELDARFARVLSSALARAIQLIDNNSTSVWSPSAARIIKAFTQSECSIKHLDLEQSSVLLTATKKNWDVDSNSRILGGGLGVQINSAFSKWGYLMRRKQLSILCLLCLAGLVLSVPLSRLVHSRSVSRSTSSAAQPRDTSPAQARIFSAYGKLPLSFEENQGQTDARVKFLVRGNGYTVFLTKNQTTTLRLTAPAQAPALPRDRASRSLTGVAPPKGSDAVVRLALVGSNPHAEAEGVDLPPGRRNYCIGNNPARWHHIVPHFARVKYRGVYPGVDLVYYGNQGQLESDYVLAPGANPGQIELRVDGARSLKLDSQGDLVLATASGDVLLRKPRAYQEIAGGRQEIPTSYIQRGPHLVGIRVSGYDSRQPLIIDPVMVYSTYLGGTKTDTVSAIAVDSAGNAYVTGSTVSTDFPTTSGALQQTFLGNTASFAQEVFVTKLNLTGSALVYSTFLGGTASGPSENGAGIAVDASGNAFITGTTAASDFPVTPGTAFQSTLPNTSGTAFLTELNPTGSALVYSSYFGGSGSDAGQGIALDASGIAYITGNTTSINFPIVPASAFQTTNKSATGGNAFSSRIDPTKTGTGSLVYSTYLGGGIGDSGTAIAVDSSAKVYVTGFTSSTDFPIPAGVNTFQTTLKGSTNAFVARIDTTVSASLLYSTYLGGSGTGTHNGSPDEGHGIAVDPNF